jgi:Lrp/AsnC family transcriptional regulator, leucine-responsive regulatory protein
LNPQELGYHVMAFVRIRPLPGHVNKIAELVQAIPQVTECHRITGEDCFILKVYLKEISNLDRVLDPVLRHGQTTTSIVQSSPVPLRSLPLGDGM